MTLSLLSLEDLICSSRRALVIGGGGDVIGALVKALPVIEIHPDSARVKAIPERASRNLLRF